MITIWKYEVEPDLVNQVYEMPIGAIILSFGLDGQGKMCFWAQVDDSAQREGHLISCVGTGWPIDIVNSDLNRYANFIGTVARGPYVWHLFDLGGVGHVSDRFEESDACAVKNESEESKQEEN